MTRREFLDKLEDALAIPRGTLSPEKRLKDIPQWDSVAVVEFQALSDEKLGVELQPQRIADAATVADLLALAGTKLEA